jgi:hypothetical protein
MSGHTGSSGETRPSTRLVAIANDTLTGEGFERMACSRSPSRVSLLSAISCMGDGVLVSRHAARYIHSAMAQIRLHCASCLETVESAPGPRT